MSANRYSVCPKCKKQGSAAREELKELYGKISAEEYSAKLSALDVDGDSEECLREDWEIYWEKDMLVFSYGCSCEKCDFTMGVRFSKQAT